MISFASPVPPHSCASSFIRTQLFPSSSERKMPSTESTTPQIYIAGNFFPDFAFPNPTASQLATLSIFMNVGKLLIQVVRYNPLSADGIQISPSIPGEHLIFRTLVKAGSVDPFENVAPLLLLKYNALLLKK